jgi:hypothetical protein
MMTATRRQSPRLRDDQLAELLSLIKGSKTVELKLTVPDDARYATLRALEIDPLDAEIRQILFFDTPDLTLNKAGVVVRARRIQRKEGDTVIKLRPVVPDNLPDNLRKSSSVGVEVDAMPGGFVCSASYKGDAVDEDIRAVMAGKLAVQKLFGKEQREFYRAHAPKGLKLNDLTLLGPIPILKLKFYPKEYGRRLVAELWNYPNGTRLLELSTKCTPSEAFDVAAETRAFLAARGVDLSGDQQTKTKTALEFFARELKKTAA